MSNYRRWNSIDFLSWQIRELPQHVRDRRLNSCSTYCEAYKDAWVIHNKLAIQKYANLYNIPAYVLGGVAWAELGGDPYEWDSYGYRARTIYVGIKDWVNNVPYANKTNIPQWVDKRIPETFKKSPFQTSFAGVSIQLRRAAETMGIDPDKLDRIQAQRIMNFLKSDINNLSIVAEHLRNLVLIDFPSFANSCIIFDDDMVRILGARYNRGPDLSLEDIKRNTSYGEAILKRKSHIIELLK